jgi:Magnesium chelatase, subunit ChlI
MLARRLTTIRPAMTLAEAIETTRIHSVAGLIGERTALVTTRPDCSSLCSLIAMRTGNGILYAAFDKTFFFDLLETVCCSPITGTFWNVWKRKVNSRFNSARCSVGAL